MFGFLVWCVCLEESFLEKRKKNRIKDVCFFLFVLSCGKYTNDYFISKIFKKSLKVLSVFWCMLLPLLDDKECCAGDVFD